YIPIVSIVPTVALPPRAPLTDQLTDWSAEFTTVAVNCCWCPVKTLAVAGVTLTATDVCRACPEFGSIISDDTSTASRSDPTTRRRSERLVLFQRSSGAPLMNQAEPLSAIIMPYFFSARRMTCTSGEKVVTSKLARSRKRCPIGGYFVSVKVEAKCRAGQVNA